jgi:SAM-dependent methyltransferase
LSANVPSDWYKDFFTELPNEFWRRAVPPEATNAEVDFLERHLDLAPGSRILDVPCGSGRHALELAARGHRVTGIDISTEAIGHARRAAADAHLEVEFVEAEMRSTPRDGSFAAALCLGNSLGYLDLPGTREFTAALAAAVRPGGGLAIDFNAAAESVLPDYRGEPRTMQTGDITVEATTDYDIKGSRLLSHYIFSRGKQNATITAIHHVYTTGHICQLLTEAGFTNIQLYNGPDDQPYTLGADRLLLTAIRI